MQRQDTHTVNYQLTLAQAKLKNETIQNYIGNFVAHNMQNRLQKKKQKNDERMTKINMLQQQIQFISNMNQNLPIQVIIYFSF